MKTQKIEELTISELENVEGGFIVMAACFVAGFAVGYYYASR